MASKRGVGFDWSSSGGDNGMAIAGFAKMDMQTIAIPVIKEGFDIAPNR